MNENTKLLLFTGSYATVEESGVQVFAFDGEAGGTLERLDTADGITNPTFVNVDPSGLKLYAIGEKPSGEGGKEGEIVTFAIEPKTGKLSELKRTRRCLPQAQVKPRPVISIEMLKANIL